MNITLRPWNIGDAELYLDLINRVDFSFEDDALRCNNVDDASFALDRMIWREDYEGSFYRAVMSDGKVVGSVQMVRHGGISEYDGYVGCMIAKDAAGQGIGTEAVRQMVEMSFQRRSLDRLTAIVYSPNKASVRLVETLGFTLEATLHHAVYKNDNFCDVLVYGLLREETGIPTTGCCEPEDELSPEERAALEPTLVPPVIL